MKPIFKISVKLVAILFLAGLSCYFLYNLRHPGKEYHTKDISFDIINFGNSHGSAFHYKVFGVKGKNAFANGNSAYYFNELYKFYKEDLNKGAVVVIPLSYFSFGVESGFDEGSPFNNKFYHFLPAKSVRNYSLSKHVDLINDAIIENSKTILKGETFKKENVLIKTDSIFSFKPFGYTKFSGLPPKINKDRSKEANRVSKAQKKAFNKDNIDKNITYLSNLIEDALENGFNPVLVTTPYSVPYNNSFDQKWLNENFYENVTFLKKKYNIPYFDYSKETKFKDISYFKDCHHLNVYGRTSITKLFLSDLVNAGFLKEKIQLPKTINHLNNKKIDKGLELKYLEVLELDKDKTFVVHFFNKDLLRYFKNKEIHFAFLNGDQTIFKKVKKGDNSIFIKLKKLQDNAGFYFTDDKDKKPLNIIQVTN